MQIDEFKAMVARLERQSNASPRAYRLKVAALAALGFAIFALFLGVVGLGLLTLVAGVVAIALSGGTALLLLAKFGKFIVLLMIPLWYLVKSSVQALFIRLPAPQGIEITRAEAPALFAALDDMRQRMRGPRFHHVLVVDEVNAAVVQHPQWGIVGPTRNYLLLGMPLLDCMAPSEALAVVAHEYGHLAGSHGRFSAWIYRLRRTWGTMQAFTDEVQGWLARLVAPLVRWYAPYFNAYTFVLARANEYEADAAAAELVGRDHAAHALKRVNLAAPRHERFMQLTFEGIAREPSPPGDLLQRWAAHVGEPAPTVQAGGWLREALDRSASEWDTHPTLRARLGALDLTAEQLDVPPPDLQGPSAAQAWFGSALMGLRTRIETRWAAAVSEPWAQRHAQVLAQRERLRMLREAPLRSPDEELEALQLERQLEPEADLRERLAAFNAAHPDHALALALEGVVRLESDEREGLALLERAIALDAGWTKHACERAYAWLAGRGEQAEAERYATRWRERDAHEALVRTQADNVTSKDRLAPHGLPAEVLEQVRSLLAGDAVRSVNEVYLVRRILPADESLMQYLLGVRLSWWARQRGRQQAIVSRLAAIEWPIGMMIVSLDNQYAPLRRKMRAVAGARLL